MRRGELKNRLDVPFILNGGHQYLTGVATASLGDLTLREPDYGAGARAIPMSSPGDVKYIRITDFDDLGIPPGHEYVTAEEVEPRYALHEGDILFARSGATAGKTFIYTSDIGQAIFAGYCIRFQIDPTKALPEYVFYYTKTERYAAWVRSIQRASGQPNINKEEYKAFTVPVPPLDVQAELVTQMQVARRARADKLRDADLCLLGIDTFLLDALGLAYPPPDDRTTYAVRLSDLRTSGHADADYFHPERTNAIRAAASHADKGLHSAPLTQLVTFVRDQAPASGSSDYLGLASVQRDTGGLSGVDETAEGLCFTFSPGDILFARLRPYLNKVYTAKEQGVCSTEFHVMRVLPKEVSGLTVRPEYLAAMLRSTLTLAQTRHMMTGNTHPRLANEDVASLVVPIPENVSTQERIVAEIGRRREEARQLRVRAADDWAGAKAEFERVLLGEGA